MNPNDFTKNKYIKLLAFILLIIFLAQGKHEGTKNIKKHLNKENIQKTINTTKNIAANVQYTKKIIKEEKEKKFQTPVQQTNIKPQAGNSKKKQLERKFTINNKKSKNTEFVKCGDTVNIQFMPYYKNKILTTKPTDSVIIIGSNALPILEQSIIGLQKNNVIEVDNIIDPSHTILKQNSKITQQIIPVPTVYQNRQNRKSNIKYRIKITNIQKQKLKIKLNCK